MEELYHDLVVSQLKLNEGSASRLGRQSGRVNWPSVTKSYMVELYHDLVVTQLKLNEGPVSRIGRQSVTFTWRD